jgi:hypothetical protein
LNIPYLLRRRNEMNRQMIKIVLGIFMLFVGLLAIASYLPDNNLLVEAADAGQDVSADAARWIGRGDYHLAKANAALDAETARWIGRVGIYERNTATGQEVDGDAARWTGRVNAPFVQASK